MLYKLKILVLFTVMLAMLGACMDDEAIKLKKMAYTPVQLDDGWATDRQYADTANPELFARLAESLYSEHEFIYVRSLVAVRHGEIIFECYPKSTEDIRIPHQIWSETKSFVSVLTGIAIDQGKIASVQDSIFKYMPEYRPYATAKHLGITIEQCLTMRSGIDYDNEGQEEEDILAGYPSELTRFIVERPMRTDPGTHTYYKNSDPQLMAKVIEKAAQQDLIRFADENLFAPMGIKNYFWSRFHDNMPFGGFGLWLQPRDLAKFGQLVLRKGMWAQRRIVPEKWIADATSPRTRCDNHDFGYYFWSDTEKNYKWCWGHAGQYTFIVPDKDLVVVITSDQFADVIGTTLDEAYRLVGMVANAID